MYLRLLWTHLRLGMLNELQYRANLALQVVQSLIGLGTALVGLAFIFSKTDTLGGWGPAELLAVVGVYSLIGGISQLVIQPSLGRFMEDVRLGSLDFTLTKPVDAQVLASTRQIDTWKIVDVAVGLAILGVALLQLGTAIGPQEAFTFAVALLAAVAIIYSFLLILATCCFWFVRVQNIMVIFQSMYEAGRWPIGIYPPWLRGMLTFLVPVGFAVTVPAEAILGRLSWSSLLGGVALAVALPLVARRFWTIGVRRYSGASA